MAIAIAGTCTTKTIFIYRTKMGSPFTIIFYSNDSMQANCLAKQCFNLVDSFVFIFSDYIDSSELSKLSATAVIEDSAVSVSPALFDILLLSKNAFDKSEGAFDITIGPLSKFWRKVRKTKQFPTDETVQAIRKLIGFNKMIIDTVNKKVTLSNRVCNWIWEALHKDILHKK